MQSAELYQFYLAFPVRGRKGIKVGKKGNWRTRLSIIIIYEVWK